MAADHAMHNGISINPPLSSNQQIFTWQTGHDTVQRSFRFVSNQLARSDRHLLGYFPNGRVGRQIGWFENTCETVTTCCCQPVQVHLTDDDANIETSACQMSHAALDELEFREWVSFMFPRPRLCHFFIGCKCYKKKTNFADVSTIQFADLEFIHFRHFEMNARRVLCIDRSRLFSWRCLEFPRSSGINENKYGWERTREHF